MRFNSKYKTIARLIGASLIIIGMTLVITSHLESLNIRPENLYDKAQETMIQFFVGSIIAVVGVVLIGFTLTNSKYHESKDSIRVRCPHCGYLESGDALFCSKCRRRL
ncbi:MAG TPA: hypothetical protein ENI14_03550 [Thermoplasmatales archaeon]|nr:hypothetical protein [Thermoplasmatales archaeon]